MQENDSHTSSRVPYFVTIETTRPLAIEPGKSYRLANDPLIKIVGGGGRVSGVVWTDKTVDDVWDALWNAVAASDPIRVSLAGKSVGRTWGKESDETKTAVWVQDENARAGWKEL